MIKKHIHELCPFADSLNLPLPLKKKGYSVNIIALGDVGATLLLGLKLLGGDVIDNIGIYDMNPAVIKRYEMEMNQIGLPFALEDTIDSDLPCQLRPKLPKIKGIEEDEIFDCDMVVFCASKSVPPIQPGSNIDVRMVQFEANRKIASHYGNLAGKAGFKGIFAVVSDPVDPLCKEVLLSSGLAPGQIKGYGLGVMNKRAQYFSHTDEAFSSYEKEGRAYGPHGSDLVIANSIENYDDEISCRLTKLTVDANLKIRDIGFKPYIAPAISSGAISLLLTLTQQWHYSSVYLGHGNNGAFLGIKNRITGSSTEIEDIPIPVNLYNRIKRAYDNLCKLV